MAWTNLATRVANTDSNAAADINALMADLLLIKGGTAGTTPSTTLEALATAISAAQGGFTNRTATGTITADVTYTRVQNIDPNGADRIFKLPTTSVLKGYEYEIRNPSLAYYVDVQGSSSGSVWKFWEGSLIVRANQDTPTTSAHWDIVRKYTKPVAAKVYGAINTWPSADAAWVFPSTEYDTHSIYSSGVMTIPKDGIYRFSFFFNGTVGAQMYINVGNTGSNGLTDQTSIGFASSGYKWGSVSLTLTKGTAVCLTSNSTESGQGTGRNFCCELIAY